MSTLPLQTTESSPYDRDRLGRDIVHLRISAIRETPENWTIYRRPDESDQTWLDLCESIEENGITDPLTLSSDYYIISGHRRYLAALRCELETVPCIIDDDVMMADLSPDERVVLLTERNKGIRIKSEGELYLEAAAAVDPEEAIRKAEGRKTQVFNRLKKSGMTEVESVGGIRRTDPSGERAEMLKAVLEIIEAKRANNYLPTSGRHIHYNLLAKKVRTSTRKNGYVYGTRPGSSTLLSKLLTDARSAGLIDPADIDDPTRPTHAFTMDGTVRDYVNRELEGLFQDYFSELHTDQPTHVELLVEKNTVFSLLRKHVAYRYRLPITSLRGYGGYPAARDVAKRFKESGKDKLVAIYISDLDPEGVDMPASWKKYLEHDFHVIATVYRAAVTPEQVKKFGLPPDTEVKASSSRAPKFIEHYGANCWEVDSMPEPVLIEEVTKAVRSVLDIEALNRAFAREKEADVRLARINAAVRRFVNQQFRSGLQA
jgi:hypothetical protein